MIQGIPSRVIVLLYWEKNTWYSLGPLAASLQKNHILYENIKGDPVVHIQNRLKDGNLVIYGESSRSVTLGGLKKRIASINNQIPSKKVFTIVGGSHASGDPQKILDLGVDFVVIGEGEKIFPNLVKRIVKSINDKQGKEIFYNLPGVAFLDRENQIVKVSPGNPINLDEYCPYSDNEEFPLHPPIELMRGCAFRCRFCQVGYMYGNPRFRSIKTVIKIVEHYIEFFKPIKKQVDIRFIAPNSLGYMEKKRGHPNYRALSELINYLKVLDVRTFFGTFPSEVRPEYITEDIVSLFDNLSNKQISVGFQSGSNNVLLDMRRGHTVEDGLKAHDLLTSHGLTPLFDFLLGTPSETVNDQWATLNLIRELGTKARVRLHYFMPLPGTPWVESTPVPLGRNIQAEIGRLAKAEIITGEFAKQIDFTLDGI